MSNIDLRFTVHSSPAPVTSGFVLPPGMGQFWRLKWDDEIGPAYVVRPSAYNVNGGTPASRTSKEGAFVPLDADHQNWLFFDVWMSCAPPEWVEEYWNTPPDKRNDTMLVKKFLSWAHSKVAWFNHEHGSDVRAVYPCNLHLKKLDGTPNTPMAKQMLGSAGSVVLQIAPEYEDGKGIVWVPCKALRPNELIPWKQLRLMPWVLNVCTVQRIEMEANGHHRVNDFDQLTVKPSGLVYNVPLITLSLNGVITFNRNMLSPLTANSKVPSPCNLPRKFGPALAHWN